MTYKKVSKGKAIENFRMEQMEIAKELCPDNKVYECRSNSKSNPKIKNINKDTNK